MPNGLAQAAQQVQSASRAPDTMLAHVTPDEAQFIDYLQGGRRVNPNTGLPEYGMFGDILKAVARAAGAIGGFMVGGPLGAAAGAGAATKLTGGSWNDALKSAALSGIGGEVGQGLTGGGWSPIGGTSSLTGAAPNSIPLSQIGSTPVNAPGFLQTAKSWPGLAAAAGANLGASTQPTSAAMPAPQPGPGINLNVVPQPRTANPYPGNPLTFAQPGGWGQGFEFYTPMNPVPKYANAAPVDQQINPNLYFKRGGAVRGYDMGGPAIDQGPTLGMRGIRGGGIDAPGLPQATTTVPAGGIGGIGHNDLNVRRAAVAGYMAMKGGGNVPPGGKDDRVNAVLSPGEHVLDADVVSKLGDGDNEAGQKRVELFKQMIRAKAGQKSPQKPSPSVGDPRALMRKAIGK